MPLQEGQSILNGEYRILGAIGEGGFGTVWKALEVKSQVEVAIKEARSGSEEAEQRFSREIKISRRMDHPNLLKADSVREEAGTLYLIMPFVQGGSLRQRLERGPLPIPDAVRIAAAVADGLGYLHGKDLVHRDVHPGNILFTREGGVKLCDLGLVQSPDFSASLWSGEKESRHPGNLYYIAPEAIAEPGQPLVPLYPAADVYMLGAVLWEMLTGRVYYNQKGKPPGTLRPEVPPWLDALVMRFLAPKPEERPADGNEAARLLHAGQADGERESRQAGLYRQGQEAIERRDWRAALSPLAALVQEAPDYQDAAALLAQARAEQQKQEIAQRQQAEARQRAEERRQQEAAAQKREEEFRQRRDALVQEARTAQGDQDWDNLRRVVEELQPLDPEAARPFAAVLAARAREEEVRQSRWAGWYSKANTLLPSKPQEALALLQRLRRESPDYPRLGELEDRARQSLQRSSAPPSLLKRKWQRLPVWACIVGGVLLAVGGGWGVFRLATGGTPPTPSPTAAASTIPTVAEVAAATPGSTPTAAEVATATPTTTPTTAPTSTPRSTATPTVLALPPACTTAGQSWTRPQDGMHMVCVPAGDFLMGSAEGDTQAKDDEKPQHTVHLDAFWIDRTEVTVAQFRAFVQATGYRTRAEAAGTGWAYMGDQDWQEVNGADWQHPHGTDGAAATDDHPVVQVSWDDATAYCAWVGATLPTEAQWEKAARGENGRIYPWGAPFDGRKLNYCDTNCPFTWEDTAVDDGYKFTAPVGSYPAAASPYGALDMAGNVWEWTSSLYADYPYQATEGREGMASWERVVLRGGAWYDSAGTVRPAVRSGREAALRIDGLGFRCVAPARGTP